jgi:hypothetical protein
VGGLVDLTPPAGKLSDSTAKLLEDMAKKSGLAMKQINEVSRAFRDIRNHFFGDV